MNTYQTFFKTLFIDIRFWILLLFVLRLFTVNQPIIEPQDWRQADGYSMARNFLEIDNNILYPRIDGCEGLTGIMGSEFPLLNYLVYLIYLITGVQWWPGRLLVLISSTAGTYYFYLLIRDFIRKDLAFLSTLFLLFSIWLSYSRKFMPDVFSVSLVMGGMYHAWYYLQKSGMTRHLLLFSVFCLAGLLSKIPAFVTTALLLPAMLNRNILLSRKIKLAICGLVILVPVIWWYFKWAPYLTETYGFFYFYMGSSTIDSIMLLVQNWSDVLSVYMAHAIHYVGFALYLAGLVIALRSRNKILIRVMWTSLVLQLIFMLKGGEKFGILSYYVIPFVPFMALMAALTVRTIGKRVIRVILVLAVIAEGLANQQHDFHSYSGEDYKLRIENIADKYTNRNDLIAVNSELNPSLLYLAHRRGWAILSSDITKSDFLKNIQKKGCKLIIWDNHRAPSPVELKHFKKVAEDEDFTTYRTE